MKTNVEIIKTLARMGVLDTEDVKQKKDDDIIICGDSIDVDKRVLVENLTDDDIRLIVAVEQLDTVESIKSMVKYFVVCSIISIMIGVFAFFTIIDRFIW